MGGGEEGGSILRQLEPERLTLIHSQEGKNALWGAAGYMWKVQKGSASEHQAPERSLLQL